MAKDATHPNNKLTRAQARDLIKQEDATIDFAKAHTDLTVEQTLYLETYVDRLRGFFHLRHIERHRQAGRLLPTGKGIFDFLAGHKEYYYLIYGNYGQGMEFLTCETSRVNANTNLRNYNQNNPGHRHEIRRRWLTDKQLEELQ